MPAKTAKRSSLDRYHDKRDFSQTEEPKGAAVRKAQAGELRYLIQKHDATRLHYASGSSSTARSRTGRSPKAPASIRPTNGLLSMSKTIP
jgi:hypothetical protein